MAANTGNKRVALKFIRDGIKSQYPKGDKCEITGSTQDLEFHHYCTLSLVFTKWCTAKGIVVKTDEDVLSIRNQFYEDNWEAVVTDGVTLTADMHKALHKVYGKQPPLGTRDKQKHWVLSKGSKGLTVGTDSQPNRFSRLIPTNRATFASLI